MPDIKTRAVAEKAVKTIDKSAIAAQRMKNAYVQAKENAKRNISHAEETPEGYAADYVSDGTSITTHESVQLFDRRGRKSVEVTKENIAKAKEYFQRKRLTSQPKKQATEQGGHALSPVEQGRTNMKTVDRGQKAVKQKVKPSGKSAAKPAKGTIKATPKSVKTARTTGRAAVKTSQQTTRAARQTTQATVKTARTATQATRVAARATMATAKKAAQATVTAVKAIIAGTKALIAAIVAGGWVAAIVIILICLIGLIASSAFGIFFSGEDTGTGQTMQTVVREINQEYEDKLDEIKNSNTHDVLEMSGSRAIWPEVLSIYAVKTAADPDAPQEVATMDDTKKELLKEIFWAMNEVSYSTDTATHTNVTETDDGHGNIVETTVTVTETTLYITVSHKTADEMANIYNFTADQRRQLAELLAEENRSIWSAVLYGIGTGDGEIVTVALSQIGNVGGQPYWSWYGFGSRVEWCACFVSWCANECGYLDAGVIPKFAGCVNGVQWFKDRGLWQDNSYEPRPGDIIFFDWNDENGQDGLTDHVGIVEKVENGFVYTVEGNSGDSCRERRYSIGHYEIYGYGTPAY